jgi:hypothetical protein
MFIANHFKFGPVMCAPHLCLRPDTKDPNMDLLEQCVLLACLCLQLRLLSSCIQQ